MARKMASFRLDEKAIEFLDEAEAVYGINRVTLLEDSLKAARSITIAAARNHQSLIEALAESYGDDATISVTVGADEKAVVLIDGQQRDELRGHLVIEYDQAVVHVFLELDGWHIEARGVARIGSMTMLSHPVMAFVATTWPPRDPNNPAIARRLGDLAGRGPVKVEFVEAVTQQGEVNP